MQNVGPWRFVGPQHLGRVLVHREKAGSVRRRNIDVIEVDAIRGADKEHITHAANRAAAHVVLRDAHLGHHVILPDDVRFIFVLVRFGRVGAVVLAVVKAIGVETDDLAAIIHVPQPVPLAIRRAADALLRPVVHAALRKLGAGILPEELPRLLVEAKQAAQVDGAGIALDVAGTVVCADENFAVGDDRIAVRLRTELGGPAEVFLVFGAELNRDVLALRRVVSRRPAAPLRPIERTHVAVGNLFQGQSRRIVFAVAADGASAKQRTSNRTQAGSDNNRRGSRQPLCHFNRMSKTHERFTL